MPSDVKLTKNQRKKLKKKEKKGVSHPNNATESTDAGPQLETAPSDEIDDVEVEYVSANYGEDSTGLLSEFKQIFEKFAKPEGNHHLEYCFLLIIMKIFE